MTAGRVPEIVRQEAIEGTVARALPGSDRRGDPFGTLTRRRGIDRGQVSVQGWRVFGHGGQPSLAQIERSQKRTTTLLDIPALGVGQADGPHEPALDEAVVLQLGAAKTSTSKIAPEETGAAKVGLREVATAQARVSESRGAKVRPGEVDVVQLRTLEDVADEQLVLLIIREDAGKRFTPGTVQAHSEANR